MASWASFAWGFIAGLLVGEVTAVFFLGLVRQGSSVKIAESPSFAGGRDMPAGREQLSVEGT